MTYLELTAVFCLNANPGGDKKKRPERRLSFTFIYRSKHRFVLAKGSWGFIVPHLVNPPSAIVLDVFLPCVDLHVRVYKFNNMIIFIRLL